MIRPERSPVPGFLVSFSLMRLRANGTLSSRLESRAHEPEPVGHLPATVRRRRCSRHWPASAVGSPGPARPWRAVEFVFLSDGEKHEDDASRENRVRFTLRCRRARSGPQGQSGRRHDPAKAWTVDPLASTGVTTRPGRLAGRPRPLRSAGSPPSGGTPPAGAQVPTGPQPRPPAEPPPPAPAPALLPCGRSGVGAARSLSAPPCTRPVSPSVASLTGRRTLPSSDPLPVAPVPSSTSSMPRTKHRPGNSARYRDHPRSSCEVQFPGTSLSLIILPVLTPSVFLLIGATHHQAPSGN